MEGGHRLPQRLLWFVGHLLGLHDLRGVGARTRLEDGLLRKTSRRADPDGHPVGIGHAFALGRGRQVPVRGKEQRQQNPPTNTKYRMIVMDRRPRNEGSLLRLGPDVERGGPRSDDAPRFA